MSQPISNSQTWQSEKHCTQLDGLRGLAILLVTLYRFTKELPTDNLLGQALHAVFLLGNRGVDLFFVLSGFLITGVLLHSQGKDNFFSRFYWRRSLRIFPLYFIALLLLLIVAPAAWINPIYPNELAEPLRHQGYLWTYSSNLYMSYCGEWNFGAMDHFWSLCVEEHFYFLWPLVIFALPRRWSLIAAIAIALASAASRTGFAMIGGNRVATDVFTLFRMDGLCLGAALAIAMVEFPDWVRSKRAWLKVGFGISCAAGLLIQVSGHSFFTISHTVCSVAWALFLSLLVTSQSASTFATFCNSRILRTFGKYSYAMYVIQLPQITLASSLISIAILQAWIPNAILAVLTYAAIMLILNYGLAILSWHLLEKHCLKLKDRFFSGRDLQPSERRLREFTSAGLDTAYAANTNGAVNNSTRSY